MTISPYAAVSPGARIADDVEIGPFTTVHDDVVLEAGVRVQESCVLGTRGPNAGGPLVVGAGGLVRSHSVLYAGSTYGPGLSTGHHVTLREGMTVGRNLQVGTMCDLLGDIVVGDHVRLHSRVLIAPHTRLGSFVWIYVGTVFTNDRRPPSTEIVAPVIEDYAIIAAHCTILPGVRVGTGALVAAHSLVNRDVPPETIVAGAPAKPVGPVSSLRLENGDPAYPWRRHFHRGYPPEVVAAWEREASAE